jgi:predicted RNA-binding protein YlxR (DUF448 family)
MESKPKKELLRLVACENNALIDASGKANGRGIYLCRDEECFDKARKKKSLSRGLGIEGADATWYENLKGEFISAATTGEVSE